MGTVTIRIPTPLRSYTNGADAVDVNGNTVGDVLAALGARHEGLLERVLTPEGAPRHFVNIFLGSEDVRVLEGMVTRVADGDVVSIVPAVAGGKQ